jgi:diaminohydroxyphosphoribosylaminopyrimidine deaminase/5-amino-6-(5-phosphoribosylamino)uracil reductase
MPQPSSLVFTPQDAVFMARAQALSEAAVGLTEPNPRVGCVITSEDGSCWAKATPSLRARPTRK